MAGPDFMESGEDRRAARTDAIIAILFFAAAAAGAGAYVWFGALADARPGLALAAMFGATLGWGVGLGLLPRSEQSAKVGDVAAILLALAAGYVIAKLDRITEAMLSAASAATWSILPHIALAIMMLVAAMAATLMLRVAARTGRRPAVAAEAWPAPQMPEPAPEMAEPTPQPQPFHYPTQAAEHAIPTPEPIPLPEEPRPEPARKGSSKKARSKLATRLRERRQPPPPAWDVPSDALLHDYLPEDDRAPAPAADPEDAAPAKPEKKG